jgi:DNA-binding NarL/FixJ family response regulator
MNLDGLKLKYKLTNRQVEVAGHVLEGLSNPQIADIMCITQQVVKDHCTNLYAKLQVKSRTQFVIKVLKPPQLHSILEKVDDNSRGN